MKNLISVSIIVNIAAVMTFGWARFQAATLTPTELAGRYSQLDREGVINQERLAEKFPELVENSRVEVPRWLGLSLVESNQFAALGGLALAGANLFTLGLLRHRLKAGEQGEGE